MHLKKLELLGFKSFVDKTELLFEKGLTGVVGPNGCGKSNVVDAFKWILGEQSAKGLRGSEMKDVIFNGTQSRKPGGFAEVTVTFDNEDRFFDLDFSEVAFTRRLFRSGESEYLINQQRCRLRDIKNMLMDTGIGASSYSIFEQGKIDVLLQANPQDRRIIFEEAAGISKYRARKAESLRALKRVEDNLARLGDVISELEKRERRVKSQASKARRYREHSERLKDLKVRIAIDEFSGSMTERAELTFQKYRLDLEIENTKNLLERLRKGLEVQSNDRQAKSEGLRAIRSRLTEIRSRCERLEESISHNRRRLDEFHLELNRKGDSKVEVSASIDDSRTLLDEERREVEALAVEVEQKRSSLAEEEAGLKAIREEHHELRAQLDVQKQELVSKLDEHSKVKNQQVQVDTEIASLQSRGDRLQAQLTTAKGELSELTTKESELTSALETQQSEKDQLETERVDLTGKLEALEDQHEETRARISELSQDRRGVSSRLELLQHLEETLEGLSQGVVEILEAEGDRPGVHDILARLIEVDRPYALALEAVLGNRAQALVTEDEEGAIDLLEIAKNSGSGALELLPLDRVGPSQPMSLEPVSGVLGYLRDFIKVPKPYASLMDRLLDGVVLVEDMNQAVELCRNGVGNFRIVTQSGEILEPNGSLAIPGEISTGLISRRSEIQELEARIQELEIKITEETSHRDDLASNSLEVEEKLEALNLTREEISSKIVSIQGQVEQVEVDRDRLARSVEVTESELTEIFEIRSQLEEQRTTLETQSVELEVLKENLEADIQDLESKIQDHGQEVQASADRVTTARVGLTEGLKREEDLRRGLSQLERSLQEKERQLETLEEEIEDLQDRREQTQEDLVKAEEEVVTVREEQEACAQDSQKAEEEDAELAEIEEGFRAEIDRLNTKVTEKISERGQISLNDQKAVLNRESILGKISEEYDFNLIEMIERLNQPEEKKKAPELEGEVLDSEESTDGDSEASEPSLLEAISAQSDSSQANSSQEGEAEGGESVEAPTLLVTPQAEGENLESQPEQNSEETAVAIPESPSDEEVEEEEEEDLSFEGRLRKFIRGQEEAWDYEEAVQEAKELSNKIRNLGNVNLDALDELDEIVDRLSFQVEQRDDLEKAERDLLRIIEEINKTCRERFEQTFDEVQKNFRELFVKCFGGGKAELVIEENSDPLEGGIDIVARPPGKKLTSLSLMSGGEKTMTTIALMFAIFRARPSPFCILDEVDAPLDEANVRRFVVLVKDFLHQSQFIVITHNKITMAVADRLYGVTMQEKGVSKPVSVEFETYDPNNPQAAMSTADIDKAPYSEDPAPVGEE